MKILFTKGFFPQNKYFKDYDNLKAEKQISAQISGNEWGYCSTLQKSTSPFLTLKVFWRLAAKGTSNHVNDLFNY